MDSFRIYTCNKIAIMPVEDSPPLNGVIHRSLDHRAVEERGRAGWTGGLAHGAAGHGALAIICMAIAFQSVTASARTTDDIARGIREIVAEPGRREQQVRAGTARAREFTWQRSVHELLSILERIPA